MSENLKRWGFRFNRTSSQISNEEGGACAQVFPIDNPANVEALSERLHLSDLGRRFNVKFEEMNDGYVLLVQGDEAKLSHILMSLGMREYA